jgi:hypothetical protein
MKKLFILCISSILFFTSSFGQVGINNDGSKPQGSAMLDVNSSSKGLLIPRVALTSTDDAATITSPAVSLLIYNTATTAGTASVTPGYYYWSGSVWLRLSTLSGVSKAKVYSGYGLINVNDSTLMADSTVLAPKSYVDNKDGFKANDSTVVHISGTEKVLGYKSIINNFNVDSAYAYQLSGYPVISAQPILYNYFFGGSGNIGMKEGNNTALGFQALSSNYLGGSNIAIGPHTLYSNYSGFDNVGIGISALFSNLSGTDNIGIGYNSLYNNTGRDNVGLGSSSLLNNTAGIANTAVGFHSLRGNKTGSFNVANGYSSLASNLTGSFNVAIGFESLLSDTSGSFNVANGYSSLASNLTGNKNTALGAGADVSSGSLTNATALGAGAIVDASNKVRIGNTSVTVIEGQAPFSVVSDERFKYNIKDNVPGLEFIDKLTPVTYYFDERKLAEYTKTGIINDNIIKPASYEGEKKLHTGFLAQDVEKIANQLGYSFDGVHTPENDRDHYSLAYSQFIMPLVKSVQEQQQQIETQKSSIIKLYKMIEELKNQNAELLKRIELLEKK